MKTIINIRFASVILAGFSYLAVSFAEEAKPSPIETARAAAQKATAEKAVAEKALADRTAVAKAETEKAAAIKAAADKAIADKTTVEKTLAEKAANAKAEAEKAVAAKAVADKAVANRAAAEKVLAEKEKALKAAEETILAEEAYSADAAVTKAIADKTAAEKVVTDKTAAVQKVASELTAARTAAEKATAEKIAAEKAFAEKTDATKAAAEKLLAEKTAAAKAASDKVAAAQAALDKANAEKAAAEKSVPEKVAAITPALDKQAAARAALIGGLKPLTASAWDYEKARHLLSRAGFGGMPDEVAKLHAMGLHGAVKHLVEFQKLPAPNAHVDIRLPERATIYENRLTAAAQSKLGNERTSRRFQQESQLRQWWLRRMVETPRPLEEKLALFWHGHFAVSFLKNENPHAMYRQNQLLRDYGAVNYAGLLRGIVQDPAMIAYLDNQVNFKGSGNENLGREILELFAMGEGQGYTEQDLREASRALTGYSYEHHTGQFKFIATRHDDTTKTIFGRAGNWGGDDLVDLILQQPATARFTATKLFQFFAHETPATETIDRLAQTLRLSNYELAPMLENLFLSEEFYSPKTMRSRIKNPVELMVGTIRTLGLAQVNYGTVDNALQTMGQTLFEPPNVKGWEEGRAWVNANRVLIRYNEVASLVENAGFDVVAALDGKGIKTPADVVDHFAKACLALPLGAKKREELIKFIGTLPPASDWAAQRNQINPKLRALLISLMSMPEYQLS